MIKLDILSDPICPWCYIGKTNLDAALQANPDHPFSIEWHPFMLNPDMPPEGMDRRLYLERKFGGKEEAVRVYAEIDRAARAAGIEINFEAIRRTPSTLDAHRLIHWAALEGRQQAMVSALFRAFFQEGRDIGDPETLSEIAQSLEMDGEMVRRLLASDSDKDVIRAQDARFREMGVRAVPTFIVGNQAVVPGAQPTAFWEELIADYRKAAAGQAGASKPQRTGPEHGDNGPEGGA